jgi:general secretion pathway protein N
MNAADRRRLTPVAAIVAAVLAALLIALWAGVGSGAHWHDALTSAELPQAESTAKPPDVAPLQQYREVWQHPLFSPTRTPEAARGGEGESSGNLQLTGVIMLPGLKMAILHDNTNGKDYRVVEGQASRRGPILVALHPRSAVVEAGGARRHLALSPGPSADPGNGAAEPAESPEDQDAQPAPEHSADEGASGMVSRHGSGDSAGNRVSGAGPASAAARARMLKARIEARRRRASQGSGS